MPRFLGRVVLATGLPLGLALGAAVFWGIRLRRCGGRVWRGRCVGSWLVMVYLVQPGVVRVLLAAFNCVGIDEGAPILLAESAEQCWRGGHAVAAGIAGTGIGLWAIGLPLGTWLALRERRAQLENASVRA